MGRETKLIKNTLLLSIGTFLPKLASFITLPIVTGCLTKTEMGSYDLITVLVSLLLPAATLQIQTALFRFLLDERKEKKSITEITSTTFAFAVPVAVLALAILWVVIPISNALLKFYISAYFMADIIVNITRQIARGIDRNLDYSISAIVSALGKMLFAVILVWWLQMGLLGATVALFAASTISWFVLALRIRLFQYLSFSAVSRERLKTLLQYSWPMIPNNLSMWVMRLSDRLVVTAVMGLEFQSVYAVATKIPALLNLAQNAFVLAWQENASIASKDEDASAYYTAMFRAMFDLMAGFMGFLVCMTPLLFRLAIRGDYGESYPQMPILILGELFFSLATFLGGVYVAFKKTKSVGITTTIAAVSNLVIDLALIRFIGLYAASLSTLISYLLLFIYRLIDVQKIIRIRVDMKHMLLTVAVLCVELVLCFLRIPVVDIVNIAIGTAVFVYLNRTLIKNGYRMGMNYLKKAAGK